MTLFVCGLDPVHSSLAGSCSYGTVLIADLLTCHSGVLRVVAVCVCKFVYELISANAVGSSLSPLCRSTPAHACVCLHAGDSTSTFPG
jgi:hypothetical protein